MMGPRARCAERILSRPPPPSATSSTSRPACAGTCSPATPPSSTRMRPAAATTPRASRNMDRSSDRASARAWAPCAAPPTPTSTATRADACRRARRARGEVSRDGKRQLDALRDRFDDFNRAEAMLGGHPPRPHDARASHSVLIAATGAGGSAMLLLLLWLYLQRAVLLPVRRVSIAARRLASGGATRVCRSPAAARSPSSLSRSTAWPPRSWRARRTCGSRATACRGSSTTRPR